MKIEITKGSRLKFYIVKPAKNEWEVRMFWWSIWLTKRRTA